MTNPSTSSLPRKIQHRPRISSDVFLPPDTPPNISNPNLNRLGFGTTPTSTNRKRAWNDGSEAPVSTPYKSAFSPWTNAHEDAYTSRSSAFTSPPPLANSRYRLAGGLDTPTQTIANLDGAADDESDHDSRRGWCSERSHIQSTKLNGLSGEHNGELPVPSPATETGTNWSQFVLGVVGTVAVKVWDFCRTSAFHGFRAGGGDTYTSPTHEGSGIRVDQEEASEILEQNTHTIHHSHDELFNSSMPSGENEMRPAKRLQTSQGSSWVMVNHYDQNLSGQRASSFTLSPRPSSTHRSLLPRPSTPRANATRLPRPSTGHPDSAAFTGLPSSFVNSSASFAQPRSPASTSPSAQRISGSAEKRKIPVRKCRDEWDGDDSMRKLNQQLKAMIREGKAALATRVDVHDETGESNEVDDEGFAEGSDGTGKGW